GRVPALVLGGPETDEVSDPADVFLEAVELVGVGALYGTGVAGRDGVDEDQVGDIEPGKLVVDELVRRRGDGGLAGVFIGVGEVHAPGADAAQVQPDRGGAGAAVEAVDDRAGGGLDGIGAGVRKPRVGREEDVGLGFAFVIGLIEVAGGRGVLDELAV